MCPLPVHENGRCGIAQSPKHHFAQSRTRVSECIQRPGDIGFGLLERAYDARGIPHSAMVEAQHGDSGVRQATCEQNELAMASYPVLRTTHDDHYPDVCRRRCTSRLAYDSDA